MSSEGMSGFSIPESNLQGEEGATAASKESVLWKEAAKHELSRTVH